MKILLLTCLLLMNVLLCFCQGKMEFNFLAKPDSIIEKRQDGYIYITSDTNSKIYKWIIPNPNDSLVKAIYSDYINDIKNKYKQEIKHFPPGDFPLKWNAVHLFKKKYYLYGPSDWMANSGFYISDSVIYITSSDPGDIYAIKEFNSTGMEAGNFKVLNYAGEILNINIKLIDKHLGIYQWIIRDKTNNKQVFMMQNSDFSKRLKMIVCDCGDRKCAMEFHFKDEK